MHDDRGPIGRRLIQFRRQLQQLNESVDVVVIVEPPSVLVFDEHFELDADRLRTHNSRKL